MKLFLSSLAISKEQLPHLRSLVGKPPKNTKMALIENAADTYDEKHRQWVMDNRAAIQSHGFDVEIIDLRQYKLRRAELKEKLASKDIVWFGGGNTYYLRWLLRDTGADSLLTEIIDKGIVYGGGSAGAIVAGPTLKHFEAADDPNDAPEVILDGLHLTEVVVVPHTDNAKFASVIHGINERLRADGFKTVPIRDSQAFIVDGENSKVV